MAQGNDESKALEMKSTKVQTLGVDHAMEHLAWDTK